MLLARFILFQFIIHDVTVLARGTITSCSNFYRACGCPWHWMWCYVVNNKQETHIYSRLIQFVINYAAVIDSKKASATERALPGLCWPVLVVHLRTSPLHIMKRTTQPIDTRNVSGGPISCMNSIALFWEHSIYPFVKPLTFTWSIQCPNDHIVNAMVVITSFQRKCKCS